MPNLGTRQIIALLDIVFLVVLFFTGNLNQTSLAVIVGFALIAELF